VPLVDLTQTLQKPLQKILESGGKLTDSIDINDLENLKVTTQFMVHRACVQGSEHLRSTVQAVYDSAIRLLDKSSWDRYWMNIYRNGSLINRYLEYSVALKDKLLHACGCSLTPELTKLALAGVDKFSKAPVFSLSDAL
jgi:hypothetical protein